jgi:hypothetical protein
MMCGITCLGGFGRIVLLMVVCLVVCLTTLLESWMPKIPKTFQALIVNNNYNFEKSRFKVFQKFCKM